MNFFDIEIGEQLKNQLSSLADSNRFPHAVVINGGNAEKRLALAQLLANWAVCGEKDIENRPCGKCRHCQKAHSDSHCDIIKAQGSGKTDSISVEEIRKITKSSIIKPNEADRKVYLLIDADKRMAPVAQNAFLKTLEEPPKNVMFILTSEKAGSLLSTILSRCTVFSIDDKAELSPEILTLAKSIALSVVDVKEINLLLNLGRIADRKEAVAVLSCVRDIFRDALSLSIGSGAVTDKASAEKLSLKLTKSRLLSLIDVINSAISKIDYNIDINLLTTWLCGELRRIAWQR